jgi:hypothetical protein
MVVNLHFSLTKTAATPPVLSILNAVFPTTANWTDSNQHAESGSAAIAG